MATEKLYMFKGDAIDILEEDNVRILPGEMQYVFNEDYTKLVGLKVGVGTQEDRNNRVSKRFNNLEYLSMPWKVIGGEDTPAPTPAP